MSSVAITTRTGAIDAINRTTIFPVPSVEYSHDDGQKFKRSLFAAEKSIPSTIGGGAHGHLYVLMYAASYNVRTTVSYTKATNPETVTFSPGADAFALAQEKVNHSVTAELFHTQEGVVLALRKAIIVNVPKDIIIELKDPEYDYDEVHSQTLLAHIIANADPESVLDARQLKALRNTALTFDGDKNLATQFVAIGKIMDKLNRIHGIATSETEMMMEWIYLIKQQTDFEDEAKEWQEKTTNNGFHYFIRLFSERDKRVRRLEKL